MRRLILAVVGMSVWLFAPLAASAHPFVPGEIPVDSAAVLTLDMAHGCVADGAAHDAATPESTRDVSVRFPPAIDVRMVVDDAGFTVGVPTRTDSYDEWTFRAPDGVDVEAPTFVFAVVVNAAESDTPWLQVFQGCDTYSHRWIATPDAPEGEPGVQVQLTAADPAAPAAGAPLRETFDSTNNDSDGVPGVTGEAETEETEGSDAPSIDFIGVDVPQSADAWFWYVLVAGVVGVLLAKRSGRSRR